MNTIMSSSFTLRFCVPFRKNKRYTTGPTVHKMVFSNTKNTQKSPKAVDFLYQKNIMTAFMYRLYQSWTKKWYTKSIFLLYLAEDFGDDEPHFKPFSKNFSPRFPGFFANKLHHPSFLVAHSEAVYMRFDLIFFFPRSSTIVHESNHSFFK